MSTTQAGPDTETSAQTAQFQPIAEYGLLGDCNSAALVDRAGSVSWLCFPRFDSPAVFSRILDPDGGHWSITPSEPFRSRRRYLPGTLVIETTFVTDTGRVKLIDALAFAEGQSHHDLGISAPHLLLRLLEGVEGEVELRFELAPRPEYGLVKPLFRRTESGGRTVGGPSQVVISAPIEVEISDATMTGTFTVSGGERVGFALQWAPPEESAPDSLGPKQVADRIRDTTRAWRAWEAEHHIYEGPHHDLMRLSTRVLQGLTYKPTGAIVAAATTSLPETVGGERNWDYRYTWIRDASLTLDALYLGACADEAGDFLSFMISAAGGETGDRSLQIMYGIGGEHDLAERELPHLRGWRDSAPVRVGNGAWDQTQLDRYGWLLVSIYLYRGQLGEALNPEVAGVVLDLANGAVHDWREKDAGMWEMRGEPRHHLSSKVLCWVALDAAVKLAPELGLQAEVERWTAERDEIREAVLTRGWSEKRQAYAQSFDSDDLDAAQLLMPILGFLPATDERMHSTIDAIADDLTVDGLVLRYRSQEGRNRDGLSGEEGTFVICSFWLVSALAMAGEVDRAEALFQKLVSYASDLGLLAEEIDTAHGELLGNFPQAFSHIGLIGAAWDIDKARGRVS